MRSPSAPERPSRGGRIHVRRLWVLCVLLALVLGLGWQPATQTYAATITVPAGGDLATAIANASAGDTLQLAAGTYSPDNPNGSNFVISKNLTIVGATDGSGNPATTINLFTQYPGGSKYDPLFSVNGGVSLGLTNLVLTGTYGS